jgi:hypothetical protein
VVTISAPAAWVAIWHTFAKVPRTCTVPLPPAAAHREMVRFGADPASIEVTRDGLNLGLPGEWCGGVVALL